MILMNGDDKWKKRCFFLLSDVYILWFCSNFNDYQFYDIVEFLSKTAFLYPWLRRRSMHVKLKKNLGMSSREAK